MGYFELWIRELLNEGLQTWLLCKVVRSAPAVTIFFSCYRMVVIAIDRQQFIVHSTKRQVFKSPRTYELENCYWLRIYGLFWSLSTQQPSSHVFNFSCLNNVTLQRPFTLWCFLVFSWSVTIKNIVRKFQTESLANSLAHSLAKNAHHKLSYSPIIDRFLVKPKKRISREHLGTLQCIDYLLPALLHTALAQRFFSPHKITWIAQHPRWVFHARIVQISTSTLKLLILWLLMLKKITFSMANFIRVT